MKRVLQLLIVGSLLALAPAMARAGWIVDWSTVAVNQKGERMAAQQATQSITGNQVRMQQPEVTTIIDYTKDRYTLINPAKRYFWSGTIDDYVRDMSSQRKNALTERVNRMPIPKRKRDKLVDQEGAESEKKPTPEPTRLPVSLAETGAAEKIAGYETEKYDVKVDGELFQEIWIAPALDLSADLDAARYLAQQQKTGSSMLGKSAKQYSALYNDPQYSALLAKGFVVKTVTHHMAGSFERVVTSVKQVDVPASDFAVPEDYRKVRLADLFDPPPTPAPHVATDPRPSAKTRPKP
ncbi:MAG: DUF4412 domain-containing protein [bacterium]